MTGASSGIGRASAELLAAAGFDIFALARRTERLVSLCSDLEKRHQVKVWPVALDVRDPKAIDKFVNDHRTTLGHTGVLLNSAGLAKGSDKLTNGDIGDWDTMIDTNLKGLLYMTRAVLPFMLAKGQGHVVNLGSVAGLWTYPGGGVYCATKFGVRAISEALRMDLLGTSIRVTNIEPGMVESEFSQVRFGDAERAKAVYRGMRPLSAVDIAESVVWCVQRPAHVNIQELVIFPTDQAAIQMVHRREGEKPS